MRTGKVAIASAAAALMALSTVAEAQWVMLARRAVGRVEQISQQSPQPNGVTYESAVVMLDAPADKVWAAVQSGVRNRQDLRITREDPAAQLVQFTNGQQIAGIKVSSLGDNLSQLIVSSAHAGSEPNASALVVDAVLRVCRDMNVECSQGAR